MMLPTVVFIFSIVRAPAFDGKSTFLVQSYNCPARLISWWWQWCWTVQEELAAVNLAKYRKAQSDLDEAEERLAENAAEMSSRSRLKNAMTPTTARVCLIRPFIHSFIYCAKCALR